MVREFHTWTKSINDRTLAGHNVHFDAGFLQEHFKFYNIEWSFRYRFVDLHSVFYAYLQKKEKEIPLKSNISNLSLDYIIDYLKLNKREGNHNALEDARLTAKAFFILINEH